MWSAAGLVFFAWKPSCVSLWTTLFCILPPRTEGWPHPVRRQIISTRNLTLVTCFDLRTEALRSVLRQFVNDVIKVQPDWQPWQPSQSSRASLAGGVLINVSVAALSGTGVRAVGTWLGQESPKLPLERGNAACWGWKGSSLILETIKLLWLQFVQHSRGLGPICGTQENWTLEIWAAAVEIRNEKILRGLLYDFYD